MTNRRKFLQTSAAGLFGAAMVSRVGAASLPEAPIRDTAEGSPPLFPSTGPPVQPGRDAERLVAAVAHEQRLEGVPPRRRAGAPAVRAGHDGEPLGLQRAVAGTDDRMRRRRQACASSSPTSCPSTPPSTGTASCFRTAWTASAASPSRTSRSGKTFVYEFEMKQSGTFMYHPHADEMVQMAMGMMGIVRGASAATRSSMPVDRDFVFLMPPTTSSPGAATPKVAEMLDFNLWTLNSRVFPGIDPLVVRRRPRARPHRQPHHDQPPDPHPRPQVRA